MIQNQAELEYKLKKIKELELELTKRRARYKDSPDAIAFTASYEALLSDLKKDVLAYQKPVVEKSGIVFRPGDKVRVTVNPSQGGLIKRSGEVTKTGSLRRRSIYSSAEDVITVEGTIISIKGKGPRQRITIRRLVSGVGVESTYLTNSRAIQSIEVVEKAKINPTRALRSLRHRYGISRFMRRREHIAAKNERTKSF